MIIKEFQNETGEEVQKQIAKEESAALYFYAQNCSVCLTLRPKIFALLHEQFPRIALFSIDAQKHVDVSASLLVFNAPILILYFQGKEFKRYGRHLSLDEMQNEIIRPYQMLFS